MEINRTIPNAQVSEAAQRIDAVRKQVADLQRTLYYIFVAVVVFVWTMMSRAVTGESVFPRYFSLAEAQNLENEGNAALPRLSSPTRGRDLGP